MGAVDRERALVDARRPYGLESLAFWRRNAISLGLAGLTLALFGYLYHRSRRSHSRSEQLQRLVSTRERELAEANVALARQVSALEEFNQLLSHDLREPLRSISGFTTLLRRRIGRYPDLTRDFDYLDAAVAQLTHLHEGVERLRHTKERPATIQPTDLRATLADTVAAVRMSRPGFAVDLCVDPACATVATDGYLVSLAVRELLDNAAKFCTAPASPARLDVRPAGPRLELRVVDRGIGIDPAYRERVFETFKRLHRREEFAGAGIGLALARLALGKLDGSVAVEATGVDTGTTLLVTLPRVVVALAPTRPAEFAVSPCASGDTAVV